MTMERETEPHHPTEKNKFLNRLDEAFVFLYAHISRDLLFNIEGLNTPNKPGKILNSCLEKKMSFGDTSWRRS